MPAPAAVRERVALAGARRDVRCAGWLSQGSRPRQRRPVPSPGQQQDEARRGEARADLALDVLGADLRAELLVDAVERAGVGRLGERAAGDAADLLQRLRVGRDRDAPRPSARARCRSAVPSATVETGMPSCLARCAAASGSLPSVRLPSERRITAAGARLPSLPRRASRRSSAALSASPVAVPPSARRLCERRLDLAAVERRLDDRVRLRREPDEADQQRLRAPCRGTLAPPTARPRRRDGSTSVADIEPDSSVTSTTDAFSTGTATVACGLASATASTAAAPASSAGGRMRRSRGWPPADAGEHRGRRGSAPRSAARRLRASA